MERVIQTERLNCFEFKLVFTYLDEELVDEYLCYIYKFGKPLLNAKGEHIVKKFERFHEVYFENFVKKFSNDFIYRQSYIEVA